MTARLVKETAIMKAVFPDIEFHDKDSGWYRIPRYTVQFGGWKQAEVTPLTKQARRPVPMAARMKSTRWRLRYIYTVEPMVRLLFFSVSSVFRG